jgi:hypothetical protein
MMHFLRITLLICLSLSAFAEPSVSPEVQKDLLRNKIMAAAQAKDFKATLEAIDEYRSLNGEFPPPLLLVEAKVAHALGDAPRALNALDAFMNSADRKSAQYHNALALYPSYKAAADTASKAKAEAAAKIKADVERQAREKAEAQAIVSAQATAKTKAELIASVPNVIAESEAGLMTVPGGTFQMGAGCCALVANHPNANPIHSVMVRGFQVSRFLVTSRQFLVFVADSGYAWPPQSPTWSSSNSEATHVSWNDATEYVEWLSRKSGHRYRLLT